MYLVEQITISFLDGTPVIAKVFPLKLLGNLFVD
jgi:hypothetical protein